MGVLGSGENGAKKFREQGAWLLFREHKKLRWYHLNGTVLFILKKCDHMHIPFLGDINLSYAALLWYRYGGLKVIRNQYESN